MLAVMGMQNTGPGYWRAAQDKLELFRRNPSEPGPEFRLSAGWVALWIFLLLLGGLVAYLAFNSLMTGNPMRRGEEKAGDVLGVILGLFLMSVPVWHYPQIRKGWDRLNPIMTVTAVRVDFHVFAPPLSLTWEGIRGFRVEEIHGRTQLVADLASSRPNTVKKDPAEVTTLTGIACIEPYGTAHVLNHLLTRSAARARLGSLRSEVEINALMVNAAP